MRTHARTHARTHVRMHASTHARMHARMHTRARERTQARTCARLLTVILYVPTHIHKCSQMHTHVLRYEFIHSNMPYRGTDCLCDMTTQTCELKSHSRRHCDTTHMHQNTRMYVAGLFAHEYGTYSLFSSKIVLYEHPWSLRRWSWV